MSLSEDMKGFRQNWSPSKGPSCRLGILVAMMNEEDQASFEELLASPVYGTSIAEMMNGWADRDDLEAPFRHLAATIHETGVQRHRRGGCNCQQTKVS